MKRKPSVAAILRKARKLVAAGWVQKLFESHVGGGKMQYCVVGAIRMACSSSHVYSEMVNCCQAFRISNGIPNGRIVHWNDSPRRTKRQVLAAFDRAIEAQGKVK